VGALGLRPPRFGAAAASAGATAAWERKSPRAQVSAITAITGPKPRFDSSRRGAYDRSMCIICIDFDRGALRPAEARRALREMREKLPPDHVRELERKLANAGDPQPPAAGSKP
jgi:hypothetical protein